MRHCPICKRELAPRAPGASAPFGMFCSERCKLIDLGQWLGEGYRIPTGPPAEGDEQASPAPDPDAPSDRLLH